MKLNPAQSMFPSIVVTLLLLAGALNLKAASGTWTSDASGNWSDTAKWSGGTVADASTFTADFSTINLTANRTVTLDSARTISGLKFGDMTPDFNWTISGGNTLTLGASPSLNVVNQSATISTVIAGTAGLTKIGAGTLTLGGATETFTGGVVVNAGTLTLYYDASGSPSVNLIGSGNALTLGGGTLQIKGNASSASSQTFNGLTLAVGGASITAAPASGANNPTLTLGAFAANQGPGATIAFNGPATVNSSGNLAATAIITTTTAGTGLFGNMGTFGVGKNGAYATVGLYDYASTSLANGTAGTLPYTVIGGSQVTGFYQSASITTTTAAFDVPSSGGTLTLGNAGGSPCVRFNVAAAKTITFTASTASGIQGFLVTPTCGVNNQRLYNNGTAGNGVQFVRSGSGGNCYGVIWQNNALGYLNVDCSLNGGRQSGQYNGLVQAGPGTVVYSQSNPYELATYLNGGFSMVTANSAFGAVATGSTVNLNGGTVVGNATFTMDSSGSAKRAIVLGNVGGGLAATAGNTMTIDGIVSGAAGTGSLTIGIPACSANGSTVGLLPGSGSGTANTTPVYATGTVSLSGANTYTGNTIIQSGTLALAATGTINSTPQIQLSSGTTFDVSAVSSYTLGSSQSLAGSGTVNGSVATASSGSALIPGTLGAAATLAFINNLDLSSGGTLQFDLSTSAASGNDQITVLGNLASGGTIRIRALSGAANLDTTTDYVLVQVTGNTSGSLPALAFDGTAPANALNYTLVKNGNNIVLRYSSGTAPTVTASASPATVTRNESTTITATVTPGSGNIASVTVDLTAIGGSSAASLVLSENHVYTNTFAVSSGTALGGKTLTVTVTDDTTPTALTGNATILLTVVAANRVWDGGSVANDNWTSGVNWTGDLAPGLASDSVTFAGTTRLTPNLDANHSVTGVTFDSSAGSFTLGTAGSTLTLAGGVTNNSVNLQTVNVPLILSAAQTLNAAAGNLAVEQAVANGGNLLTIDGAANASISGPVSGGGGLTKSGAGTLTITSANSYSGATTVGAGILQLNSAGIINGGAANVSAVSGARLVVSGGSLTASAASTIAVVSSGLLVSSGTATFNAGLATDHNASGNATLIAVTGGNLNTTSLSLGRLGGAITTQPASASTGQGLYVNGGAVNITGNFDMSSNGADNSSTSSRMDSGSLTIGGTVIIGCNNSSRWSVLDINGGTLALADTTTGISVGGPNAGNAALLIRAGTATVGKIGLGYGTVSDTVVLKQTGGALYVGSGGIVKVSPNATASVTLNGGTLGASAGWSSTMDMTLGGTTIKAADAANAAQDIALSGNLDGSSGLTKTGNGTLTLSGGNSYAGNTTISAGTLALSGSGSLAAGSSISIAAGATFDVSALTANTYTLGASAGLSAAGTSSPATLVGKSSGGTVDLGSRPITLTYDGSHPALTVSQGTLALGGNQFTVNGTALTSGTYNIATVTSGNITDGGSYPNVSGTAIDSAHYGKISMNSGNVVLTVAAKPVANADTYSRAPGTGIKIFVNDLLANDTADTFFGYSKNYVTSEATTHNGVTLGTSGAGNSTIIVYPSSAGNTADYFTYTIDDGHGGTISGTVNINLNNNVTGQATINLAGQTATLGFFGLPGYRYVVQRSVDSLSNWQDLTGVTTDNVTPAGTSVGANGVITAPGGGAFTVTDPSPPLNPTSVYYQLRAAP